MIPPEREFFARKYGAYVLSHDSCVNWTPPSNCFLIRVLSDIWPFGRLAKPYVYADVLEVKFDDVDGIGGGHLPIQPEHAKEIVDAFERNQDKMLVVHCHAGISRSSAIAAAWFKFQGKDESEAAVFKPGLFKPNMKVYRAVMDELHNRGKLND